MESALKRPHVYVLASLSIARASQRDYLVGLNYEKVALCEAARNVSNLLPL